MITVQEYDADNGWENEQTFSPEEIVAMQLGSMADNEIQSACPGLLDFSPYTQYLPEAKAMLDEFWQRDDNRNNKIDFICFIQEHESLYYVETSATMSRVFARVGAVPLPNNWVRYLINDRFIVPAQDGIRFMYNEQSLPDLSSWKTIYLLDSIEQFDAVYRILSHGVDYLEIKNKKDAVGIIMSLYENTCEDQIYEQFPLWREAVTRARYYLRDIKDKDPLNEHETSLLYKYSKYYLSDFPELTLHDVPAKYLVIDTDKFGVTYSANHKRLLKAEKSFCQKHYVVHPECESMDRNAMCNLETLESIHISDSVRRLGDNLLLGSALKELTIPCSVDFPVGGCLCEGCKSLTTIEFCNRQEYLDIAMFNGCESLECIVLPKGLIGLSDNVFSATKSLKSVDLEEGLRYIGGECFMNSGLDNICFPSTIEEIAEDAFQVNEDFHYHIKFKPDYKNLPLSLLQPMPAWMFIERFQESWILQLLKYFSCIVISQTNNRRNHLLESYKQELKKCLKWINSIEILPEFPYYTLTTADTTKKTEAYDILYFYMSAHHSIVNKEDWVVNSIDLLSAAAMFMKQLPRIYELIEDCDADTIDEYVDSLGGYDKLDDSSIDYLVRVFGYPLELEDEDPDTPITIQLTHNWSQGPSITTDRKTIEYIIYRLEIRK